MSRSDSGLDSSFDAVAAVVDKLAAASCFCHNQKPFLTTTTLYSLKSGLVIFRPPINTFQIGAFRGGSAKFSASKSLRSSRLLTLHHVFICGRNFGNTGRKRSFPWELFGSLERRFRLHESTPGTTSCSRWHSLILLRNHEVNLNLISTDFLTNCPSSEHQLRGTVGEFRADPSTILGWTALCHAPSPQSNPKHLGWPGTGVLYLTTKANRVGTIRDQELSSPD